jgi:hypothetical protein
VDDSAVPDRRALGQHDIVGQAVGVDCDIVLYVRPLAEFDRPTVGADDRPGEHSRVRTDGHVTDQRRRRVDVGRLRNLGFGPAECALHIRTCRPAA